MAPSGLLSRKVIHEQASYIGAFLSSQQYCTVTVMSIIRALSATSRYGNTQPHTPAPRTVTRSQVHPSKLNEAREYLHFAETSGLATLAMHASQVPLPPTKLNKASAIRRRRFTRHELCLVCLEELAFGIIPGCPHWRRIRRSRRRAERVQPSAHLLVLVCQCAWRVYACVCACIKVFLYVYTQLSKHE